MWGWGAGQEGGGQHFHVGLINTLAFFLLFLSCISDPTMLFPFSREENEESREEVASKEESEDVDIEADDVSDEEKLPSPKPSPM